MPPFFSTARKNSGSANKEVAADGKSDDEGRPNLLREQLLYPQTLHPLISLRLKDVWPLVKHENNILKT